MHSFLMRVIHRLAVGGLAVLLSGCIGLVFSTAGYEQVAIEQKHKADVLARFGEPARREQSGELEVWLYKLVKRGVAGPAVESTSTVAYLLVAPVFSTTHYDDNLRVFFKGDDVVRVEERRSQAHGAACGVPSHSFPNGCYSSFGSDKAAAPAAAPPASAAASAAAKGPHTRLLITPQSFIVAGTAYTASDEAAAAIQARSPAVLDIVSCPAIESRRLLEALNSLHGKHSARVVVSMADAGERECPDGKK